MILLADSGSTKTDWCLYASPEECWTFQSAGINPYMLGSEAITQMVQECLEPVLASQQIKDLQVFFYGAGCTPQKENMMQEALQKALHTIEDLQVKVASDLLGAARALCQHDPGIAAILGTGSNTCYYDGHSIIQNISPLGYILGDEGSGAVLGRLMIGQLLKGHWPQTLKETFTEQYKLTSADIIQRVYREPQPNRFLASLSPFLYQHRKHPCVHAFLIEEFGRFFQQNIQHYQRPDLPVHCTGSIAYYYQEELAEAAHIAGFHLGKIVQSPLQGLLHFHQQLE